MSSSESDSQTESDATVKEEKSDLQVDKNNSVSMALAGNINPYTPGTDFDSYEDRINQFFVVNNIKEDKKTALFITISGEAMYEILKSLTHPEKPSTKPYADLIKLVQGHFTPKRNKRAERYRFYKAAQETSETLSEFIIRLKSLAQTCKFGDFLDAEVGEEVGKYKLKILDEALTDRFITGLRNEKIKQHLFNDDAADFEKCCQKALQFEMVEKESRSKTDASVNNIRGNANRSRSVKRSSADSQNSNKSFARNRSQSQNKTNSECRRCGRHHDERNCPAREWKCYTCQKTGHIAPMCRSKSSAENKKSDPSKQQPNSVKTVLYRDSGNYVNQVREMESICLDQSSEKNSVNEVSDILNLFTDEEMDSIEESEKLRECEDVISAIKVVKSNAQEQARSSPLQYELQMESKKVNMECDTGAVVSIISLQEFNKKFSHVPLIKDNFNCSKSLCTVSGENLTEYGKANVWVEFCGIVRSLPLIVVELSHPFMALMGRNWLDVFFPLWREQLSPNESYEIKRVSENKNQLINLIKSKYPRIVNSEIDTPIEGFTADLVLKKDATPVFHCAYTVPFRLKDSVSAEIDKMCKQNIFRPIKYSNWASPLVVRVKPNNTLRFCIDGKVTINKYLETDHYPLPRIDDIFASLSNCKVFCVLDLKGAFKQVKISENCQELLTVNAHKGLFACNRLIDGVSCAPAIFQSIMDRILLGVAGVKCFIDDIIIGGKDREECKNRLFEVLHRLNEHNVRINLEKCKLLESSVKYLGHIIENNEIRPNREKVQAILDAPAPKDVSQLQSYLGLLNYYGQFIPNLSSEVHALYELLQVDREFVWSEKCNSSRKVNYL